MYGRLTKDKNTEKFFKVFYDRMKEAQTEIKNTVSVNTGDSMSGKSGSDDNKDTPKKDIHAGRGSKSRSAGNISEVQQL